MGYILFIILVFSVFSLFLSLIRTGKSAIFAKIFRILVVIIGIAVFSYWFFDKSIERFLPNTLSVQINNKLPQPIDFYVLKIERQKDKVIKETYHPGKIRPEFYRKEFIGMDNSDEFWIVGYLGKENLVYFSQHIVPNKKNALLIEVQNYIVQSEKLSKEAEKQINAYDSSNKKLGILATLDMLLLFLNFMLLLRRK